jgi:benzoyl-CoA reductase/2-hydroxyglutaryl-CoA dehydratase subunit BcrC/BadD/HgdB
VIEDCAQITLSEWEEHYKELQDEGLHERWYGGRLSRHVRDGDRRLLKLRFDSSTAALRLWNFLLTEEDRLKKHRDEGKKLLGCMKDLGTVPVMAYSFDNIAAFYPDGAWWIPCVMELSAGLLSVADSLGVDESFCPVRAMLGAFVTGNHFPIPDMLTCSVGATCDDFSAIAQRLEGLGYSIFWWEIPHRRTAGEGEQVIELPGDMRAAKSQVDFVKGELGRVRDALEDLAGEKLNKDKLVEGIKQANRVRFLLGQIREICFTTEPCPMGALEMLIAEMLAIHFCSDREETIEVLNDMLLEIKNRVSAGIGIVDEGAVRVFWVNPVADLYAMNLLETCGGRICGTEYLFSHALDLIPEDVEPMEALARQSLADPMVGPAWDRAQRICKDIERFGAEAVVISRIPGASHCALEGQIIGDFLRSKLDNISVLEIEVGSLTDSVEPGLRTRLEGLIETVEKRRRR